MVLKHINALYGAIILGSPKVTLTLLVVILGFFASYIPDFKLDASADSLLLESDSALQQFKEAAERYQEKEFLFVVFTPKEDLFSPYSLGLAKQMRDQFRALPNVEAVTSLVDVPLLMQEDGGLLGLENRIRTLESPDVDIDKAREELLESPIYRQLIVSADGRTTAFQINLQADPTLIDLSQARDRLKQKRRLVELNQQEVIELQQVEMRYKERKRVREQANQQLIAEIRQIIEPYKIDGKLHLGGIAMVVDDMITFIKNDIAVFGIGIFLFLISVLWLIFRSFFWVMLPLASCLFSCVLMIGLLGLLGWQVTVISSNFISLMLIITMSMNIHLAVRYRQLERDMPDLSMHERVLMTVKKLVRPCLYTVLTTIIAFASLVVSEIKPVIDFGWMMTIGLGVAFITSFLLFPALLVIFLREDKAINEKDTEQKLLNITLCLARFTQQRQKIILIISMILILVSLLGITRLQVENSFINYFRENTEIYKGLKLIDEELGGTTPLDILISFEDKDDLSMDEQDGEEDLFGAFETTNQTVWFTPTRVDTIKQVQAYLENEVKGVGKVLSLATVIEIAERINGKQFDAFELAVAHRKIPDSLKVAMLDPYLSIENNEVRISTRILDSKQGLRRNALIKQIQSDLTNKFGLDPQNVKLTGLLVLYNNMLQSLFSSQIMTLGVVMAGIAIMLLLLFRSVSLAIIGIIPNILAAMAILGLMGWLSIPLDMMTITIAAITIGIAVDNSIHYIYRFREEYKQLGDYNETLMYCHANIGRAVFYTAFTVIVGFSILVFSNFVPTIYFGVLTAMAMFTALLAALTLLPALILYWQPFKGKIG